MPSPSLIGDDWRQGQAHIVPGTHVLAPDQLEAVIGPFSFYDLLFVLEAGPVTPREVIAGGCFGEAVWSLRGHVRPCSCAPEEEALALLDLFCAASPRGREEKECQTPGGSARFTGFLREISD
jgi:hypothetical protein